MHLCSHTPSSSYLRLNEVHFDSFPESRTDGIENPILVKVNTLDNFIQSIQIKYDCLLKIDVQGFEKKV